MSYNFNTLKRSRGSVEKLTQETSLVIKTGIFGADMKVALTNNGPVTILIDSKNKE